MVLPMETLVNILLCFDTLSCTKLPIARNTTLQTYSRDYRDLEPGSSTYIIKTCEEPNTVYYDMLCTCISEKDVSMFDQAKEKIKNRQISQTPDCSNVGKEIAKLSGNTQQIVREIAFMAEDDGSTGQQPSGGDGLTLPASALALMNKLDLVPTRPTGSTTIRAPVDPRVSMVQTGPFFPRNPNQPLVMGGIALPVATRPVTLPTGEVVMVPVIQPVLPTRDLTKLQKLKFIIRNMTPTQIVEFIRGLPIADIVEVYRDMNDEQRSYLWIVLSPEQRQFMVTNENVDASAVLARISPDPNDPINTLRPVLTPQQIEDILNNFNRRPGTVLPVAGGTLPVTPGGLIPPTVPSTLQPDPPVTMVPGLIGQGSQTGTTVVIDSTDSSLNDPFIPEGFCNDCESENCVKSHPTDCQRFVMCEPQGDSAFLARSMQCNLGLYWDSVVQTCKPKDQVLCRTEGMSNMSGASISDAINSMDSPVPEVTPERGMPHVKLDTVVNVAPPSKSSLVDVPPPPETELSADPKPLIVKKTLTLSQCPRGWHFSNKNCYFFSEGTMDWADALARCREMGSYLARIYSTSENSFLQKRAKDIPGNVSGYWMGGSDQRSEGEWEWYETREDIGPVFWHKNENPEAQAQKDCLVLNKVNNFEWDNLQCEKNMNYICKKSLDS